MLFQIIKLSIFSSWRLWHQTDHKEKLYGQRESNLKHKAARPYELFFFAFVFYSSILRYNLELSFFTRRNAIAGCDLSQKICSRSGRLQILFDLRLLKVEGICIFCFCLIERRPSASRSSSVSSEF